MSLNDEEPVAPSCYPRADPLFDALVCNPLAAIKRNHGLLNAGDLPLVQVQVFVYRLGGEERSAPAGALGEFLQPLLAGRINANADGCRGHVPYAVCA